MAIVVALVVVFVIAPIAIAGLVGSIISWTALIFAGLIAFKLTTELVSKINELIHRCNVPDYNGLSQARRDKLAQQGVSPEQWNSLKNKQRLGYFNITAAIAAAGLSLLGWLVDWAAGGIQQDRTFFRAGPGATNLLAQVRSSNLFSRSNGHKPNNPEGYRFVSLIRSPQLSFSTDGLRLDADIDFFNPNKIPFGSFLHGVEVFTHTLGRLLGGGSRTNPYNVAYRSSWECK